MDVLKKELNAIYESQNLISETLDYRILTKYRHDVETASEVESNCLVITDAAADYCYIFCGIFANLLGISNTGSYKGEMNSSDEDIIYRRVHPEDLVDKRMLEYEFFKFVDPLSDEDKLTYKATCRFRIKNRTGKYIYVDNSTRIARLSPNGKIWLILCSYNLSSCQESSFGITPRIVNTASGEVSQIEFTDRRAHILTDREKDILNLIKEGKLSKQIATMLGISVHTVNRHRQNILEKLSVGNSVEAIMAATLMKLL